MERLAAPIPKPRINLALYTGVLAPNAQRRGDVVRYDRPTDAARTSPDRDPGTHGARVMVGADAGPPASFTLVASRASAQRLEVAFASRARTPDSVAQAP
jgi:hypothetical protein